MRSWLIIATALTAALGMGGCPPTQPFTDGVPLVTLETSMGDITIETDPVRAPRTTENFVQYASEGFYNGTLFHRVVPGFVIQAGGFTSGLVEKPGTRLPIVNEASNGLSNVRLTVGMARGDDPNSATTEFYINLQDNIGLDATLTRPGYAVFGRVVEGADVVDAIAALPRESRDGLNDVPTQEVVIQGVRVETGPEQLTPEWEIFVNDLQGRAFLSVREILLTLLQARLF